MFSLIYLATYAPYRETFEDFSAKWANILELMLDFLFIFDIIITFFTPYERYNGTLELRLKKIAINYLTGGFLIDAIASTPFEIVFQVETNGSNRLIRLARIQRVYKIVRVFKMIKLFKISKYGD
jgi:potassium voltage-gated channel Eag-related subfamily H protein 2/potassium voltage-gated channel Eag-related subfamily H protein 7